MEDLKTTIHGHDVLLAFDTVKFLAWVGSHVHCDKGRHTYAWRGDTPPWKSIPEHNPRGFDGLRVLGRIVPLFGGDHIEASSVLNNHLLPRVGPFRRLFTDHAKELQDVPFRIPALVSALFSQDIGFENHVDKERTATGLIELLARLACGEITEEMLKNPEPAINA